MCVYVDNNYDNDNRSSLTNHLRCFIGNIR